MVWPWKWHCELLWHTFTSTCKISHLIFHISFFPILKKILFNRLEAESQSKYFKPPERKIENKPSQNQKQLRSKCLSGSDSGRKFISCRAALGYGLPQLIRPTHTQSCSKEATHLLWSYIHIVLCSIIVSQVEWASRITSYLNSKRISSHMISQDCVQQFDKWCSSGQ